MRPGVSIAVDVMGGDTGVRACVPGALALLDESPDLGLILVGRHVDIESELARCGRYPRDRVRVVDATEVVAMDESPREAIRRKRDSSMRRALDLVGSGEAHACVSAGNTGALMATAHFVLGMVDGVDRPAIIAAVPSAEGSTYLLDVGANIAATPAHLFQFAVMGAVVCEHLTGRVRPRVGLLNIGHEDIKGHEAVRLAHERLKASRLHYIGFVEGHDTFTGKVDVVVTDGFTGNVALKTMEGLARLLGGTIRNEFTAGPWRRLAAFAATPALKGIRKRLDPRRYNGATMVGLAGVVIKSHGSADAVAFAHAVRLAIVEARSGVPLQITRELNAQAA